MMRHDFHQNPVNQMVRWVPDLRRLRDSFQKRSVLKISEHFNISEIVCYPKAKIIMETFWLRNLNL